MMIEIQKNEYILDEINPQIIEHAIALTLSKKRQLDVDITLRLTNDEEMRQLNKTFRGYDRTTDVLSFNQEYIDPDTNQLYLGDIIISIEQAKRQASENKHFLEEECAFLAIHGTLHLLGYDHDEPENKMEMWQLQDSIFSEFMSWFRSVKDETKI